MKFLSYIPRIPPIHFYYKIIITKFVVENYKIISNLIQIKFKFIIWARYSLRKRRAIKARVMIHKRIIVVKILKFKRRSRNSRKILTLRNRNSKKKIKKRSENLWKMRPQPVCWDSLLLRKIEIQEMMPAISIQMKYGLSLPRLASKDSLSSEKRKISLTVWVWRILRSILISKQKR